MSSIAKQSNRPKPRSVLTLSALIAIALLINPWTMGFLFTEDHHLDQPTLSLLLLVSALYFALLAALYSFFSARPKIKNFITNNLVLCVSALFILAATKVVDLTMSQILGRGQKPNDLIFLHNTSAKYSTFEFTYTAHINSYGFRGAEPRLAHSDSSYKIVVFGDSFTFGWGLEDDQTWPVQAEKLLLERGISVQIFNLGKPGASPAEYVNWAPNVLRTLKPDLIIVNVLQGEDLYTLAPDPTMRSDIKSQPSFFSRLIKHLSDLFRAAYPSLCSTITGRGLFGNRSIELDITPNWQEESAALLKAFTPEERSRYQAIGAKTRELFLQGELNPRIVYDVVKSPRRFSYHEHLQNPRTQEAIALMADYLATLKRFAQQAHCEVIVSLVPHMPYVSAAGFNVMKEQGFNLETSILTSTASETAARLAAEQAALEFYSALPRFKSVSDSELFYLYDSHFNVAGAREYAQYIAELIAQKRAANP